MTTEEQWKQLEALLLKRADRCDRHMTEAAANGEYREADQFKRAAIVYRECINLMHQIDGTPPIDPLEQMRKNLIRFAKAAQEKHSREKP